MNYKIDKKNKSKITIELVLTQIKAPLIIGCVAIPFAIYFLTIGYVVDKEALLFGYCLAFLVLFLFTVVALNYFNVRKDMKYMFGDNLTIEYKAEFLTDKCTIHDITNNKSLTFQKDDIFKAYLKKHTIILKLKNKKIVFFPNQIELLNELRKSILENIK